jgi:hypothetical protein
MAHVVVRRERALRRSERAPAGIFLHPPENEFGQVLASGQLVGPAHWPHDSAEVCGIDQRQPHAPSRWEVSHEALDRDC